MLKIDKSHKKIDLTPLKDCKVDIKRVIGSGILLTITVFLLKTKLPIVETDFKEAIRIVSNEYYFDNSSKRVLFGFDTEIDKEILSAQDLEHVTSVSLVLKKDTDLSFLEYTPNIEELKININDYTNILKTINSSNFKKNIKIEIIPGYYNNFFTEEDYSFLKDISSIDTLTLGKEWNNFVIDYDFLSNLKNISNLKIAVGPFTNIEPEKIAFVKELELTGLAYDIPISVSQKDIDYLKNKTSLTIENEKEVEKVNRRIEQIASTLNVDEKSTDKEKIDAILTFILNKYEYPLIPSNTSGYYIKGFLDASLNSEKQICGNYSSMFNALAHYLNLETYNICSHNHAWNLVKVNDEYFYVDSTFIDLETIEVETVTNEFLPDSNEPVQVNKHIIIKAEEAFKKNNQNLINRFEWYLRNIDKTNDYEHKANSLPPNLYPSKSQNKDETVIDLTNKKYTLKYNGKKYLIDAMDLLLVISLFSSSIYLGVKSVTPKNEFIKKRK